MSRARMWTAGMWTRESRGQLGRPGGPGGRAAPGGRGDAGRAGLAGGARRRGADGRRRARPAGRRRSALGRAGTAGASVGARGAAPAGASGAAGAVPMAKRPRHGADGRGGGRHSGGYSRSSSRRASATTFASWCRVLSEGGFASRSRSARVVHLYTACISCASSGTSPTTTRGGIWCGTTIYMGSSSCIGFSDGKSVGLRARRRVGRAAVERLPRGDGDQQREPPRARG